MNEIGVYKAIAGVQAELATIGISKDKKNQQQGYQFRGIDDVYDVLSPILAKHGLCILPRVLTRNVVERQTKSGGALFYVTVESEFDLVSSEDGSIHTIRTFGEAMDSGDKATNKAMSAAYKYAAFQTFCIPIDVEDADAVTHEVKAKEASKPLTPTPTIPQPEKVDSAPLSTVTEAQIKRLFAIANKSDKSKAEIKEWLSARGMESSKKLNPWAYEELVLWIEKPKQSEGYITCPDGQSRPVDYCPDCPVEGPCPNRPGE